MIWYGLTIQERGFLRSEYREELFRTKFRMMVLKQRPYLHTEQLRVTKHKFYSELYGLILANLEQNIHTTL